MDFDVKLFKSACKDYLIDEASDSKFLRENVTIGENERFNEWLKNISDEQAFDIVCEKKYGAKIRWDIKTIRQLQSVKERVLKYGFVAALGVGAGIATGIAAVAIPLSLISLFLYYEGRKWWDPCYETCRTQRSGGFGSPARKDVYLRCRIRCGIKAADHVLSLIDKAKAKCSQVKGDERKKCNEVADKQKEKWLKKKAKLQQSRYAQWSPAPERGVPT